MENNLWKIALLLFVCLPASLSHGDARAFQRIFGQEDRSILLIEAIQKTLTNHPEILLQKQRVKFSQGRFQSAKGRFDWQIKTSIHHNKEKTPYARAEREALLENYNEHRETVYNLGLVKHYRTGVSLSPLVESVRTEYLTYDSTPSRNDASVRFTITIPLQKGLGRESTAAQESAAREDLERQRLLLRHSLSKKIRDTTKDYWNYLTTHKILAIHRSSEEKAQAYVAGMKRLVETDQKPRADLEQLLANQASKASARLSAEQELLRARRNLGLSMGLAANEIIILPEPGDSFPEVTEITDADGLELESLLETALQIRTDIQAARVNEKYARTLLTAAVKDEKPQIDLLLSAGYNGLDEGENWSATTRAFSETEGSYYGIALQGELYFGNNSAEGLTVRRKSEYDQAVIQTVDLERNIHTNLQLALEELKINVAVYRHEEIAVASYRKAVANETKKLKIGMSTVTDVITIEDRLIRALLQKTASSRNYANSLIEIQFLSGTLLPPENDWNEISHDKLTRFPRQSAIYRR